MFLVNNSSEKMRPGSALVKAGGIDAVLQVVFAVATVVDAVTKGCAQSQMHSAESGACSSVSVKSKGLLLKL